MSEKEEKKACCDDGTCSLCVKKEEIKKEIENKSDEFDRVKEESRKSDKIVITETEKEKIKKEIRNIKKKRSSKEYPIDFKQKIFNDKLNSMSKKKHTVNKALVFVLSVVIVASVVAGVMAMNFFNNFRSDKISKDMFENKEVVELDGQTWVLKTEPKVVVEVVTSADCGEDCKVDDVISFLKVQLPTLEVKEMDAESSDINLKYVPTFVFDENITKTDFYSRAKELFVEENGKYVLQTAQLGFSVEQLGVITDEIGFTVGDKSADVSVIAVTDFGCEECAVANPVLDKLETEYKGKAKFNYKIYTDMEDARMVNISLAAFCADDQDKFDAYFDNIFARQSAWMAVEGDLVTVLENYAAKLNLNGTEFSECLTSKKHEDKLKEVNKEIMDYGFTSVPVYFVDGERIDGVPTYEGMDAIMKNAISGVSTKN